MDTDYDDADLTDFLETDHHQTVWPNTPYPQPTLNRVITEPSDTWAPFTIVTGAAPVQISGGIETGQVAQLTIIAVGNVYITNRPDPTVSTSLLLLSGSSIEVSTRDKLYAWSTVAASVSVVRETWGNP